MADILLTNDDGVHSPGFLALKKELNTFRSLLLIGPSEQRSWISKAVTRFEKVKVQKVKLEDGSDAFAIQGTPVDAIIIGLFVISEQFPKLVISGINTGANAGNAFIFSSGTVGAAIEAAMVGIPSIAVSLVPPYLNYTFIEENFRIAAQLTKKFAQRILKYGLPSSVNLINLNVPYNATMKTEIIITNIAKLHYGCILEKSTKENEFVFTKKMDSTKGAKYNLQPGTDAYTIFIENKISITPVNIDLTGNLHGFRQWLDIEI
ncbi:MAG: 5'/3'-nucleotidase SurE [Promethearchaeota archaeon]